MLKYFQQQNLKFTFFFLQNFFFEWIILPIHRELIQSAMMTIVQFLFCPECWLNQQKKEKRKFSLNPMNQSEVDCFQTNKKKFFVLLATMYLSVYFGQWMIHRKIRVFSLWINTRFVTTIVVVTNCFLIKVGQQKKTTTPLRLLSTSEWKSIKISFSVVVHISIKYNMIWQFLFSNW